MTKDLLIEKVKSKNYTQEQLVGWVSALPRDTTKIRPITYKIGDVFLHPIFQHPYVLLEKKENCWLCGLLTSEETCPEIIHETRSRFFKQQYFTKTVFIVMDIIGSFIGVYDNNKHLKEVTLDLKKEIL